MEHIIPISADVLYSWPEENEKRAEEELKKERQGFNRKIIVLDDDPTGTQTVHDVPVYTDWSLETVEEIFQLPDNMVFILTNSRSFSRAYTKEVHKKIAENIACIAKREGKEFLVISRGDSTLRGHFPLETETLKDVLSQKTGLSFHGEIICPFFPEGGRYTINNIHYVREGEQLLPAGQTEFAKDKSFSYQNSHLGAYIEEKSHGVYTEKECVYISLEELRSFSVEQITEKLMHTKEFQKVIVNAISYTDVKVFCICWLKAMKMGKNFLARSAAGLTKIIGDVSDQPLLDKQSLVEPHVQSGGLVIVGSHVKKSTAQLNALMESEKKLHFIEFNVNRYFEDGSLEDEIYRVLKEAEDQIQKGTTVVIYTSRQLIVPDTEDKDKILRLSVEISDSLTEIVHLLTLKPKFIIAKGGITSSDVATKGLSIRKAMVMGQIRKGIPVWMTGNESKFPNMPYIIFPGNVGEVTILKEIVEELD